MSEPAAAVTPTAPETVAAPVQENPNLHRFQVDGEEIAVDIEELKRGYGHQKAANKILQEGKTYRQQAEQLVQMLKSDPISVLKDPRLGVDVRKIAEEYLAAQLSDELMDPRERELRDLKAWKQQQEEALEKEQLSKKEQENAALTEQYIGDYSNGIMEALDGGNLPKTPHVVRKIAYYMHEGLKRNLALSPKDVVGLVRQDLDNDFRSIYGSAEGESLIGLFGEETAAKIRKWDLARLKQSGAVTAKAGTATARSARIEPKASKGITKDEWRAKMAEIARS